MSEHKVMNYYYPPEWTPKKGSLNRFHKLHPLRQRASKLKSEGILIIRFEVPYNMFCGGCNVFIAQGSRFNAEKKNVGMYFTTKIWSFRMKCMNCNNWFEFQTDPKNQAYIITSGGKKKTEAFNAANANTISFDTVEERMKLKTDPLYALEHKEEDRKKALTQKEAMDRLIEMNEERKDSFDINELARQKYREIRRDDKIRKEKGGVRHNMKLLPHSKEDDDMTKEVSFKVGHDHVSKIKPFDVPKSLFDKGNPISKKKKEIKFPLLSSSFSSSSSSTSSSFNSLEKMLDYGDSDEENDGGGDQKQKKVIDESDNKVKSKNVPTVIEGMDENNDVEEIVVDELHKKKRRREKVLNK